MAMTAFPLTRPVFGPAIRQIASLTSVIVQNQVIVTITTTVNHYYKTGLVVRLDIPLGFGSTQLNQLFAEIVVTSPTVFTMAFNSSLIFDPFFIPSGATQAPLCIPIAQDVSILYQAVVNLLPNG